MSRSNTQTAPNAQSTSIDAHKDEALAPRPPPGMRKRDHGVRRQLPVRPAFALTIHKAQGATLNDAFTVECSNWWESGQGYVALSRASDPSLMHLQNFSTQSYLQLDERVRRFHEKIRAQPLPYYVPQAERMIDARESERMQSLIAAKRARNIFRNV